MDHKGKAEAGGEFAQQATTWATPTASESANRTTKEAPTHGNSHGLVLAGQVGTWPTPRADERKQHNSQDNGVALSQKVTHWPTPQVGTGENSHGQISGDFRNRMEELLKQPQWSSPRASDGKNGGPIQWDSKGDLMLPSMAAHWPTPDAHARERINKSQSAGAAERPTIALAASSWPTPAARDAKGANSEEHALVTGGGRKHMDQLANFVAYSLQAQPIRDGQESSRNTLNSPRHLNPIFGAWLMGWPSAWVIAEPHASSALATASWRSKLRRELSSLCGAHGE
ncbi:hypothetical protein [Variovorax sp. RCC_210]|uniref:hypothetical protein n=1 Tax=Variovorax sp. RCC_210 TaxID=3239217 RepID=UPI0035260BCF